MAKREGLGGGEGSVDLAHHRADVLAHHLIGDVGHNRDGGENERILSHGLATVMLDRVLANSNVPFVNAFHIFSLLSRSPA
jgi:hypothetical protein